MQGTPSRGGLVLRCVLAVTCRIGGKRIARSHSFRHCAAGGPTESSENRLIQRLAHNEYRCEVARLKIKDLIDEAEALPVEERALVVDSLLRSLNPPESRVDEQWAAVARKRLEDVRSGAVETIPGEEVFAKIWNDRAQ